LAELSTWGKRIKRFYDAELWTLEMVKDGVRTNTITEDEYKIITGLDYAE